MRAVDIPETKYARSGDVNIAYQVFGQGPLDLVYVPGFISNLEVMWQEPGLAHVLRRLASFSRVILFDKRGTGLSDRVQLDQLPTLEQRMDDVRAVMDEVGSKRSAIIGHSEGGGMSILFAATYPDRTAALVLLNTFAKRIRSDDYPWAPTLEERLADVHDTGRRWGSDAHVREFVAFAAPSRADDAAFVRWVGSYMRNGASPAAASALVQMNSFIDVRHVLPTIRVPTLVLHRTHDRDTTVEEGRWLAQQIHGARFVELPGADHIFWSSDQETVLDEVEEFLTGVRPPVRTDRFLATAVFTDIVSSTQKAAELGDSRWRALVERHHSLVRKELERFRGREVDTAGDGFFATFDGPGRAARCAVSIVEAVRPLGIDVRAGLHTGECEQIAGKVGGIAVIIGSRVKDQAGPGEVLASSTVKDLVAGSGIEFEDRGTHALKGVPGEWRLYRVAHT